MQQIFNFLIRYRNTLLFLTLLFIALGLTIQSHNYHKSKFVTSSNFITGEIYTYSNTIQNYFNLKAYNIRLLDENTRLKNQIQSLQIDTLKTSTTDSLFGNQYTFIPALVINNSYHKVNNYITLNRGEKDSIAIDMGVITDKGIVGIIENVSKNYSRVISILNSKSPINAQLKKTDHFGSLVWNGKSPNKIQLVDIPRLAPLKIGDTIITGGRSTIFPKGILIGTIHDFQLNNDESYYTVNVSLFNDMTNIGFVNIISNNRSAEIKELEKENDEQ